MPCRASGGQAGLERALQRAPDRGLASGFRAIARSLRAASSHHGGRSKRQKQKVNASDAQALDVQRPLAQAIKDLRIENFRGHMSALGDSRSFARGAATSDLPRSADDIRLVQDFAFGPMLSKKSKIEPRQKSRKS
jgi:ATP-dependent phosphoenolpyruvate carboxykinase